MLVMVQPRHKSYSDVHGLLLPQEPRRAIDNANRLT